MQQRHFLKRSGKDQNYTKTDRSAISLRVAAKTRTKPTGAPSTVYRTNMPRWRIADSIRYIRDLLAKQNPTLLSWPICLSIDLMHFITPLGGNTKTLSRPIPTRPSASVGTGWNETAGKTTTFTQGPLRNQRYSAFRAKYADIFEKETTILSWTWKIYGIQYVKVDIRTNKPLNGHFRFRLSFSVSLMD